MADILIYLLAGATAGTMAGLLGIGGGVVMVPALLIIFTRQHVPQEIIMHLALGSSLAIMVVTSLASFRSHHQHGAVDWRAVRGLAPGTLLGAALGGWLALPIPTQGLQLFFALFLMFVAWRIWFTKDITMARRQAHRFEWPLVGLGVGALSSLLGIGGGTLTVPYLNRRGKALTHAIGTSSALGWFIALAGSVGFIIAGWQHPLLPAGTFGFVAWSTLVWIAPVSYFFAPIGSGLSHRLPVGLLRKIFSLFLILVAVKLVF